VTALTNRRRKRDYLRGTTDKNIGVYLVDKMFLTIFERLDYNMLCTVTEQEIVLGLEAPFRQQKGLPCDSP